MSNTPKQEDAAIQVMHLTNNTHSYLNILTTSH